MTTSTTSIASAPVVHLARSTCAYDCPDCCGLVVEIERRKGAGGAVRETVLSVRGDPEHGFTQGTLCPKVNRYERTVHAPGRLLTPLLRRPGTKKGGAGVDDFRPASWEEATALIASTWKSIAAAHGGEAILPVSYAGTMGLVHRNALQPLFHKLGASRLDRGICTPAQDEGWAQVMGTTPGPDPDDVLASDLVVLWGTNALATNIHFLHRVKEARKRGARAVLIDTWRQATADHVDDVILVRPGSDGAFALGVLHVLVRDALVDRAYIAAHVDGFDAIERDVLPHHTPARTAEVSGVAADDVVRFAHAYGKAKAPFIRVGGGPFRTANGANNLRAMLALPAATAAWAKHGGGLLASTGTRAAFDISAIERPDLMIKPTRVVSLNRMGHALTALDAPRVMSIYVSHCNPAAVCPDQNAVLRGLARDDLFTVVHERFLTDTARYADVVLPAPTMVETADLYRSYGQFYMQRTKPALAPLGESRSNWDTVRAIAAALGFTDDVFAMSTDDHIDALLKAPSPWRRDVDMGVVNEGRAVRLTVPRGGEPGRAFGTPSGKIELAPASLGPPRHVPAYADVDGGAFPLRLQPAPSLHRLNSSFSERDDLKERVRGPRVQLSPTDAASRKLVDGQRVLVVNELGSTALDLHITDRVPPGVAVVEGVFTVAEAGGPTINALMSQRLTDHGAGSTFSDNRVDVQPLP